jgi:transcriptional regulator with XRE-family HTH domain
VLGVVNSVLARRRLAQGLRRYRHRAGRSLDDVAGALDCSVAKISRLETGISGVQLPDLRAIAGYLELSGAERAELEELLRRARAREWWQAFSDVVPPYSATLYGLEDGAATIRMHSIGVMPGLLQTEDYARAQLGAAPGVPTAVVDRRLALRMRRRQLLDRADGPRLTVLMDEGMLQREIGGAVVMADQWAHVVSRIDSGVVVRVIRHRAAAHGAEGVAFTVFGFDHEDLAPVGYVEALTHNSFVEDPEEVAVYEAALDSAERVAASPEDSRELLAALALGSR